jgi:hypothetical protein
MKKNDDMIQKACGSSALSIITSRAEGAAARAPAQVIGDLIFLI